MEQRLVVVLKSPQVNVAFEVVVHPVELIAGSSQLLVDRLDTVRQQPDESERSSLFVGERRSLV